MTQPRLLKPPRPRRPAGAPNLLTLTARRQWLNALLPWLSAACQTDPDFAGLLWPRRQAQIAWVTLRFVPLVQGLGEPDSFTVTLWPAPAGATLELTHRHCRCGVWPITPALALPILAAELHTAIRQARSA